MDNTISVAPNCFTIKCMRIRWKSREQVSRSMSNAIKITTDNISYPTLCFYRLFRLSLSAALNFSLRRRGKCFSRGLYFLFRWECLEHVRKGSRSSWDVALPRVTWWKTFLTTYSLRTRAHFLSRGLRMYTEATWKNRTVQYRRCCSIPILSFTYYRCIAKI